MYGSVAIRNKRQGGNDDKVVGECLSCMLSLPRCICQVLFVQRDKIIIALPSVLLQKSSGRKRRMHFLWADFVGGQMWWTRLCNAKLLHQCRTLVAYSVQLAISGL